jgi:hypothetical protein
MAVLIYIRKLKSKQAIKRINDELNRIRRSQNPKSLKIKEMDTAQAIFDEGFQSSKFQNILNQNADAK